MNATKYRPDLVWKKSKKLRYQVTRISAEQIVAWSNDDNALVINYPMVDPIINNYVFRHDHAASRCEKIDNKIDIRFHLINGNKINILRKLNIIFDCNKITPFWKKLFSVSRCYSNDLMLLSFYFNNQTAIQT